MTTKHRTYKQSVTETKATDIDLNRLDTKARKIGLLIQKFESTYADVEDDRQFGFEERPAGTYFVVCVYNTRNGEIYNRARATRFFNSDAERSTWLDKYIAAV